MLPVARIRLPESGVIKCRMPTTLALMPGDACLVDLAPSLDTGRVLELFGVSEQGAGEMAPVFQALRKLTPEDERRIEENRQLADRARHAFEQAISHERGQARILRMRFSFDRSRLFIRYAARMPVDLRRFIGQIQRDYKTHVDLWQVGVRDEAALVGCLGPCGRASCCCSWQQQFQAVNVRMAKVQEMSLNPITINGTCGRLKCCLRFEYDQYRVAAERLPDHGFAVRCQGEAEQPEGVVIGRDVMRGRLTVRTRDGRFLNVAANTVTVLDAVVQEPRQQEGEDEDSSGEWPESEPAGLP